MSHYWNVPFAEIHLTDGMITMDFSNHDSVSVPEHEGITGLFREVENFMTSKAMHAVIKRAKELK